MKLKTLMLVFVSTFAISSQISAQSSGTKTAQDLKKAEEAVGTGKILINLFKKKSVKKEVETNEDVPNTIIDEPEIGKNEKHPIQDVITAQEDDIPLNKDAAILFKNCVSKTTNAEKNEMTAYMNIIANPDGTQFYINDQYSKDYTFSVFVYPIDINHDGVEEMAIVYGHAAISGDNVISTLFIKDNHGLYNANFGFIGSLVILPNSSKSFPNIALGGPGFEFPVWHWDGKNYSYHSTISNETLEKSNPLFIEEASKLYVESISN